MRITMLALVLMLASKAGAEVLMHCGPSEGHAYFFYDPIYNSNASEWNKDGMSKGRIIFTLEGDNWDILFGDAAGSSGYRSDVAVVAPLAITDRYIRIGAFADNYSDIYNFNLIEKTVVWTSNKSGPLMGKIAI